MYQVRASGLVTEAHNVSVNLIQRTHSQHTNTELYTHAHTYTRTRIHAWNRTAGSDIHHRPQDTDAHKCTVCTRAHANKELTSCVHNITQWHCEDRNLQQVIRHQQRLLHPSSFNLQRRETERERQKGQ